MTGTSLIAKLKAGIIVCLILTIQFGSSGLLINKHFCKGELKEVSILISNKGCIDDQSFADRLTFKVLDCQKGMKENGVRKAPCCDFESWFNKILVFQETLEPWESNVTSLLDLAATFRSIDQGQYITQTGYVSYHPPPEKEVNICTEFGRMLI